MINPSINYVHQLGLSRVTAGRPKTPAPASGKSGKTTDITDDPILLVSRVKGALPAEVSRPA